MIVVTPFNIHAIISHLMGREYLAADTETTGLRPYHGDRLFCVSISDWEEDYYFNFRADHPNDLAEHKELLRELFGNPCITWFFHNAKFDLAMLSHEGIAVRGQIHDTKCVARLIDNDLFGYTLGACVERAGVGRKDEAVENYIMEKGLWEWRSVPGKKQRQKDLFYAQVPYDIIAPYACRDTNITYKLGIHQLNAIETVDNNPILAPKLSSLVEMDKTLLKVVFDMEKTGILIDKNRCYDAIDHEERRISSVEEKIEREVGLRFDNTNKILLELFKGEQIPSRPPTKKTQKINPKFDSEAIKEFKSDFAREVLEWRDAKSRVGFYYNFLYHSDENNVVHCSLNQDGTATGRFSSNSPNLQNLTKEEEERDRSSVFSVRSVFIPRPDYFFAMLDYDQMEYRLMLDYAGAKSMIEKVNSGLDVHTATAEDAHVSRTDAKTVNFGLIYGLGDIQLSNKLRVSLERAREIKDAILDASPEIRTFLDKVKYTAKHRKYIFNWAGRRYNFLESRFSYKAANYLIQGGCADLTKLAMVRCAKYLNNLRSRLLLTIHDELVFEVHRTEAHILPDLKKIMETVWEPRNGLALTCGVDHSFTNLSDKIEGMP